MARGDAEEGWKQLTEKVNTRPPLAFLVPEDKGTPEREEMKPYHESSKLTLYHGDSLAVLPTLTTASFDAVITDPPYNVGLVYANDATSDRKPDYQDWCAEWFEQLKRVCRGAILISCGVSNLGAWHRIEQPKWVLCWWKPASAGRCVVGFNNWEPILVYGKPPRNICDVLRTTEQAALAVNHKKHPIAHPCPKPVEWATKQILATTKPGARILDPFAGSGTTLVAARAEGRACVGIEVDAGYCATAVGRLSPLGGSVKQEPSVMNNE
jgi:site-specific DNA-methyltransferase (adenine-specific)